MPVSLVQSRVQNVFALLTVPEIVSAQTVYLLLAEAAAFQPPLQDAGQVHYLLRDFVV